MRYSIYLFFIIIFTSGCTSNHPEDAFNRNRELGIITSFSEMVAADVKRIALSSPMTSDQMDQVIEEATSIAYEYGVELYRESDLIKTSLFPAGVAEDKEVLVIYKGLNLEAYLDLKEDAKATDNPDEEMEIARRFGRMLGYSPQKINQLLAENTDFRVMDDFGIDGTNVFLYYEDLENATRFYTETLGLELIAEYDNASMLRVAGSSLITLVDAAKGMHDADEPKTVAIALLTNELKQWYDLLVEEGVEIKYEYKAREGSAHDGFVAIDPEGYLLEFETFKQHPENEKFIPYLDNNDDVKTARELSFNGMIIWLYYQDLLNMQGFYENVLGLEMVADQGWTKIYRNTNYGYFGLVDERRGMHDYTDEKAVTVSFILSNPQGWFEYVKENNTFPLRSDTIETGPNSLYHAFVGYDPEKYYLEFDIFNDQEKNKRLLEVLGSGK